MSKRFFHTVLTISAVLAFFSCRKETSIERPESANGTFMADVSGSQWIAEDSLKTAYIAAGEINLAGISADHRQLIITLNDTIPGVYTLDQSSTSAAYYGFADSSGIYVYSTNQGSDSTQAGGTVTVTEIDPINHTISGTFSFNVYRDVDGKQQRFTDGVFRKLPYTGSDPAASGSDTLNATIDGVKWSAPVVTGIALSNQLIVTGLNVAGTQSLALDMPANIVPGQYSLDYTALTCYAIYIPGPNIGLASSEGTLEIIENDATNKRVRGKFVFKAVDPTDPLGVNTAPRQVTSGYFAVTYQ